MKGLGDRVAALRRAVDAVAGRGDVKVLADAEEVVRRAGERVAFDGEFTVVALAGATGSGKSSLFNAVTGTELAQTAVRRPTTSRAMGVAWGSSLPHDLLDWLDIPRRHLIAAPADDPLAK
ncbi:MAG: 50S ribosome-binding GTPase, partial [Propionibacteriaceae bacterium]|nr:50S ribosome-binding GTPase [Propionibacteriaceae bacterium]